MGDVDVVVERDELHEAQRANPNPNPNDPNPNLTPSPSPSPSPSAYQAQRSHIEHAHEATAAMRNLRGWFAEATTPRGSRTAPGLLSLVGQGVLRLMAPREHHEAATLLGAQ